MWLQVDTRFTMRGRVAGIALKRPQLKIDLLFRDNTEGTFRFAPDVARSGFWLSPTIQNTSQFVRYLNDGFLGIGRNRIVARFRLREHAEGHAWAVRDFQVRVTHLVGSRGGASPAPGSQ
jgi:hypothetical protein